MKSLDSEIFFLCRPKNIICSSYYDRVYQFLIDTYPLSDHFEIHEFITKNKYIKYCLKAKQHYTVQIHQKIEECVKNHLTKSTYSLQ